MSDHPAVLAARFHVQAEASPGLLSRLLEPFAKRDLVPDSVHASRDPRDAETMRAEIALEAMPAEMVHLVAGNLGQVIGVLTVRVERAAVLGLADAA